MITGRQAATLRHTLRQMGASIVGHQILHVDQTGSTQDELISRAPAEPDGTVLVARRQIAGRGRMGRFWASPPGTLAFSVLLRPRISPEISGVVMLASAIAMYDTIKAYVPRARLKWPNDIIADGKIAGILLDASVTDSLEYVVVGVGVNVACDLAQVAKSLPAGTQFDGADSIHLHSQKASAYDILAGFLAKLDHCYASIHDRQYITSAYSKRCWSIGRPVACGDIRGIAKGIDNDGALLVETDTRIRRALLAS